MSRLCTPARCLGLLVLFAVGLVGCDQTPSSVEEFDIQGTMNTPLSLVVTPELEPTFTVEYQGLESPPSIEAPSRIGVEAVGEPQGDPRDAGNRSWKLSLAVDNIDELLVQDPVLIRGNTINGKDVVDTLSAVATTSLPVQTDFTSSFYTLADYEGDVTSENYEFGESFTPDTVETEPYEGGQRTIETTGGTEVSLINADPDPGTPSGENRPQGSNGVRFLEIDGASGGSVTIDRVIDLPNSDFFSFLVRQASSTFSLTITMIEETGGGTTSRDLNLPIPAGNQWFKITVPFEFFGEDFNPVDPRSGGNGPLVSIRLSSNQNVVYAIDELLFGIQGTGPQAEFHDFEETTLAFGPPLSDNTFGFSTSRPADVDPNPMVSDSSDGYTSRLVSGSATWGYDLIGGAFGSEHGARVDVDGDDVLSFLVKDRSGESSFEISFQSDGDLGEAVLVDDLPQGEWERVEIPMSSFGTPQDALDPGLRGFNVANQGGADFLIDDIKIMPKN